MASVKLAKLRDLHAHLTELLAEFDAPAKDTEVGAGSIKNTIGKPATDSDADQPYAQGQDGKPAKSMDEAFPHLNRLR